VRRVDLGVSDPGLLSLTGGLSLRFRRRSHERDQRIRDDLLHAVFRGPVEREAIDDGANDHAAPHELADNDRDRPGARSMNADGRTLADAVNVMRFDKIARLAELDNADEDSRSQMAA
jgi:hypothetical protein